MPHRPGSFIEISTDTDHTRPDWLISNGEKTNQIRKNNRKQSAADKNAIGKTEPSGSCLGSPVDHPERNHHPDGDHRTRRGVSHGGETVDPTDPANGMKARGVDQQNRNTSERSGSGQGQNQAVQQLFPESRADR